MYYPHTAAALLVIVVAAIVVVILVVVILVVVILVVGLWTGAKDGAGDIFEVSREAKEVERSKGSQSCLISYFSTNIVVISFLCH